MGLTGFAKALEPAEQPKPSMRDALYGDRSVEDWANIAMRAAHAYPWSAFIAARNELNAGNVNAAAIGWIDISSSPGLEPMHYLQAWHFLRAGGLQPPAAAAKTVLGVIVEVGMPRGLDLVAAYRGHSARYYYNIYKGGGIAWEHPDNSMDGVIDQVMHAGQQAVSGLELWNKPRPPVPGNGQAQVSLLTISGIYFGQAPLDILDNRSPIAIAPVVGAAAVLMGALVDRAKKDGSMK
jgi:hypothetical protein